MFASVASPAVAAASVASVAVSTASAADASVVEGIMVWVVHILGLWVLHFTFF